MKRIFALTILINLVFSCPWAFSDINLVKEKFEQAMLAFRQKDHQKAIALFEETIAMAPSFAQAYNYMAMAHYEMDSDEIETIRLLEKAIEIDPELSIAYDNLGKIYYGLGKFDEAEKNCLKAIEIDPNMATAKLSLGWIYLLGKGMPREAIGYFEDALKKTKTDYGQFGLGMAYFMDGQNGVVLEMITSLRQNKREDLAEDLEAMLREGKYLPPAGVGPLIKPKNERPNLAIDSSSGERQTRAYAVRLSGKFNDPLNEMNSYLAGEQPQPLPFPGQVTGAQRIQKMQQNYQQQGFNY